MAIRVHHGVSPAAVAGAGFGGGQGRSRAAAMRGGAAANAREQAQIRQIGAQAQQAQSERAFRSQQAELGRDFQREQADLQYERGSQRMLQNFELQQQAADSALGRKREFLDYGLTTKQRHELQRLADAEAEMMASSDYTDAEKAELRKKFDAKRAGFKEVAKPKELTAREKFDASTYTDPKTGTVYSIGPDNKLTKIHERPDNRMSHADRTKYLKIAYDIAKGDGLEAPSQAKVEQIYQSLLQQSGAQPGGAALPGEPVVPGTPGAPVAPQGGSQAGGPDMLDDERFTGQQLATSTDKAMDRLRSVDITGRATQGRGAPERSPIRQRHDEILAQASQMVGDAEKRRKFLEQSLPNKLEREFVELQGFAPDESAHEPGDVNDKATVDFWIEQTMEEIADAEALRMQHQGSLMGPSTDIEKQANRFIEDQQQRLEAFRKRKQEIEQRIQKIKRKELMRRAGRGDTDMMGVSSVPLPEDWLYGR